MCENCWKAMGSPKIDNDAVRAASDAIIALYSADHPSGGGMHVVTDDWNVDDECVALCEKWCASEVERACYRALLPLTKDERGSAIALSIGFWDAKP